MHCRKIQKHIHKPTFENISLKFQHTDISSVQYIATDKNILLDKALISSNFNIDHIFTKNHTYQNNAKGPQCLPSRNIKLHHILHQWAHREALQALCASCHSAFHTIKHVSPNNSKFTCSFLSSTHCFRMNKSDHEPSNNENSKLESLYLFRNYGSK